MSEVHEVAGPRIAMSRVHAALGPHWRRHLLLGLVLAAAAAFVPNLGPLTFLYTAPSAAMEPAIPRDSVHLVSRLTYGLSRYTLDCCDIPLSTRWPDIAPKRGDIVVFRLPRSYKLLGIKRVIGLPGDRVEMRDGRLILNGTPVPRVALAPRTSSSSPSAPVAAYTETLSEGVSYTVLEALGDAGSFDTTPEVTVPRWHVFVMGDNRDLSMDSRAHSVRTGGMGLVRQVLIVGGIAATISDGETAKR